MKKIELEELLRKVREGTLPVEEAVSTLQSLPFSDLGFAKLDHHWELRKVFPEVVFCEGKSLRHIKPIA